MIEDLRDNKVLDNTVVIITGDHGPPLGYVKKNIRDKKSWQSVTPLNQTGSFSGPSKTDRRDKLGGRSIPLLVDWPSREDR
jgi:arylsulfatase A-like enzyme